MDCRHESCNDSRQEETLMRTMTDREAGQDFSAALEAARSEPVLIRKDHEGVAVLVSLKEFERLRAARAARFNMLCDDIAEQAERRGLTDDIFDDLMRDVS